MSSGRSSQNSNRSTRKPRRDHSPVNRREKSHEVRRNRSEHEKYRSDHDLSRQDEAEKDRDRKKKENTKTKRPRSPRRIKDSSSSDRKLVNQRKEIKIKSETKDKPREKKTVEVIERHPLFQDNSRLAQLIAQITTTNEESSRRQSAAQSLLEYVYDAAHLEPIKRNCSNIFSALEEVFLERGHNELKDKVIQCYASVGHVLGIDCDKFFQWVFSKIPSAANDNLRVLYLRTIAEAILLDVGKLVFCDTMPMIMASLQDVLENADASELLLIILDVLIIVARDYPHIFAEYFRDTVDILVGWHIDTAQNEQLTKKTADCLISFHPYWVSDMRFSLTLLGQFLEDMEAYAEELSSITHGSFSKEDTPSPFVSLPKLTALTKVFTTVVAGLGEFFSPGREAKITANYITDTVKRIIKCVDICGYDLKFEKLLIAANDCLTVLVASLGTSISVSCLGLVCFINGQLANIDKSTYRLLKSALLLVEKVVSVVGQSLPANVIPELIGKDKPLVKLKLFADQELLAVLLQIFQTLLSIKNIPILEMVYRLFVADIMLSYNTLMTSTEDTAVQNDASNETVVKDNIAMQPSSKENLAIRNAYTRVVFDLAALAEIAIYKSSITGAWKVEPSTYSLLTSMMDPSNAVLAKNFPGVQFAILSTLFCHSQRCNNFIPSSKTKSTFHSEESVHLIQMLCKIQFNPDVSSDVKCLCAVWLSDIANSIAALPMDVQKRQWDLMQVVDALILLCYDFEPSIRKEAANSILKLTKTNLVHPMVLGRLLGECLPHLTDTDGSVRDSFRKMVTSFPADLLASLPTIAAHFNKTHFLGLPHTFFVSCKDDLWLQCKKHMCRLPTGTLHSYGFKLIMNYLLTPKTKQNQNNEQWTENIFFTSQRLSKIAEPVSGDINAFQRFINTLDSTFPINGSHFESVLCFWLTWEAANFCVLSRLKTPLGKAIDTFQSIEGVLKDLESKFRENTKCDKTEKKVKSKQKESNQQQNTETSNHMYVQQAVLLLHFLENLEKLMYNAYEGTATSLPPAIRAVRTFFRTNRSTCYEWLNRIQGSITILASLCGSPEKAIRTGFLWLQRLKNNGNTQGSEFEHAIVTVVDALTQLHCYECVHGVLEWSRKVVGRNFFWLNGAILKAKGSLENAAEQLKFSLQNYLSPDRLKSENVGEVKKATVTLLTKDPVINADSISTQFLVGQVTDCYLQLCDWNEVQEWNKTVNELHQKFPSVEGLFSTIDHSYVKAMMKFEEHDFAAVHEQLEMIPGATVSNILQEQFPVLGTVKEEKDSRLNKYTQESSSPSSSSLADSLTPQAMLCQSRIYLMQALTLYWTSGLNTLKGSRVGSLHSSAWETVDNLLSQANEAASTPLHCMLLNYSMKNAAPFLMQLKSITAIRETLMVTDINLGNDETMFMNVYGQNQYIDASKTDISILNEALRTTSYLQYHHSLHKKGWVGPAVHSGDKLPNVQMLQVMTAKLARKQGNKKLAESLLAKQLSLLESKGAMDGKMYLTGGAQLKLKQLTASVSSGKIVDPLASVDILKESAKLKRTLGNTSEAIDVMCSSILLSERQLHAGISKSSNSYAKLSEVLSRSYVTLAKWMLTENRVLSPIGEAEETVSIGPKVREVIKVAGKSGGGLLKVLLNATSKLTMMTEGDVICGHLLHNSTYRCPTLGKTWFAYADWCYKWGRKTVEQESTSTNIELLDEEKDLVKKALPKGTSETIVEKVINVLNKAYSAKEFNMIDEDISNVSDEGSDDVDVEKVKNQLLVATDHAIAGNAEVLNSLIGVWTGIIDRVFSHYKQAATAYFTYLKLSGTESFEPPDVLKRSEYGNITATLRLLRLLVKYSGELKQHMQEPFSQTPTKPWRSIIPQLFARLNHPEKYVQTMVANLLCRIAKDSPQLIVYPTVVGCTDMMPQQQLSKSSAAGILRAYQYQDEDECEQPVAEDSSQDDDISVVSQADTEAASSQEEQPIISVEEKAMLSSLHVILDTLTEDTPLLVQEVKCVIQELRRITLLWDELWLGSLTQLHQEAQRRMHQLDAEIKRVNANNTLSELQKSGLIKEKHSALMKPLFYALERLHKITSQQPETPHEQAFQNNFGAQINKAIDALKNPVNPSAPEQSWELAKQLYQTLQMRAQKKPMNNLAMEEISPTLSKGNFQLLPLPGIEGIEEQTISLKTFSNDIQILPTKTKPKKLIMIGSDGQRYPYLFKGLEDLHLDERIMQFLEICNHMFSKEDKSGEKKYFARHYSVTPLGPRSGLIQWVDGATPLFALYRRWQQREAAAQALLKTQADKNAPVPVQPPLRPTELFHNKINPLLKEKGIDMSTSRKEWPLSVLKKALQELSNDTPVDLLSRELWCASTNAADWWAVTQSYSRSLAVMSMIGYVIGLGDRHLDNILVDLTTGEVVHIDYNVCFEKGKALRVPEKVPFRMTRNMEAALGVTGVEGIFRSSCEKVMHTLRQGREILLTLLEAFVYDPLIDWTTANDAAFAGAFYGGGAGADEGNKFSRKEMERGITQTLLSTRVAEMSVLWTANKNELISSVNKLKTLLEHYLQTLNSQWYSQQEISTLQHQASLLKAALVKSDHPLHSLQSRYDKQEKLLSDLKSSKDKIEGKLLECDQMQNEFKHAFMAIQGNHFTNLFTEVCKLADVGSPCYGPAVKFLNSAGQSNVVAQCEQIEEELSSALNQRRSALRACLETILSYSSLVSQFNSDYMIHQSLSHWIPLFKSILVEPSSEKCSEALTLHQNMVTQRNKIRKEVEPLVRALEAKLNQYFTEQNSRLIKLCDRRNHEQASTSTLSGPVTETWNALRKFNGDAGAAGATSLACVTVTALSTLNKRQLVMENAAAVAGDRLMHLTSRDGDWFLDELSTMCGNTSQLLSVLKNNPLRMSPQKNKGNAQGDVMDNITVGMQVVFASVKTYNSLQELMSNFRTIIVPEAVKAFLKNDPSVLRITEAVKAVVDSSEIKLHELCDKYQEAFKERQDVTEEVTNIVNSLKNRLEQLVEADTEQDDSANHGTPVMTAGQMLLAGFSGLFTKVDGELLALYEIFRKLKVPEGYDNIDLQQEQKKLKLSKIMCFSVNSKWLSFLFLKKLVVIHGFFDACLQQSTATRDIDAMTKVLNKQVEETGEKFLRVFNEELLSLPVKQFIAECVQFFIIGLPSQALTALSVNYIGLLAPAVAKDIRDRKVTFTFEDVCKKIVEYNLKSNSFPHHHLSQASSLINAHDAAWRKYDLVRRLDASIAAQKEVVQRAQLQLARFQWLHEEIVVSGNRKKIPLANPTKLSIINEIKKKLQAINQVEQSMPNLMDRYAQLQSSIEQRLKWASGANPALNIVLQEFGDAVSERKAVFLSESKLTPQVHGLANAIVKMEMFKSNVNDANIFDQAIVAILQECQVSCEAFENCMGDLGDVEQFMNSLQISVPPKEPITVNWMKSRLELIDAQMKSVRLKEPTMKSAIQVERESLKSQVSVVKGNFTSHHALVGEVKTMLKTLAKDEEAEECLNVRHFIQAHNKFSEDSSIVLKKILSLASVSRADVTDEIARLNEEDSSTVIAMMADLTVSVSTLHDQLLLFGMSSLRSTEVNGQDSFASALRKSDVAILEGADESVLQEAQGDGGGQPTLGNLTVSGKENVAKTPMLATPPVIPPNKLAALTPKKNPGVLARDPKTGKALQEKNLYALNVWKRVKAKLEGRDLDSSRRAAVSEQVAHIIQEATSQDNLSQLYEGWTPWV